MVVGGADKVLARHFEAVVTSPEKREGISPLCSLFLMLYRCDDDHFQDSLAIIGGVLFPCLLATSYIHGSFKHTGQPTLELIRRLEDINLDMRDLPWSHQLFDYFEEVVENAEALTDMDALSLVLSWLVDGMLSRRENNKRFVMHHSTLFDSIIKKFASNFRPDCALNSKVSQFSKFLALATVNRLIMVENSSYLRLLFLLLHDEVLATRNTVFETLALLSIDRTGRTKLFNFLDHKLVDISIKALQEVALASTALEFLGVLVQHFSAKILLLSCPALLAELVDVAVMNESYSLKAAKTLRRLADTMSINVEGGSLLDCILQLCRALDSRVRYEGVRTLASQCQARTGCGFFVVHVPEAVDELAALVLDPDDKVRVLSLRLVANLAGICLNVKALGRNGRLLEALVKNATAPHERLGEKTQASAMLSLLHLIRHEDPKQVVSQHLRKSISPSCTPNSKTFGIREIPTLF